MDGKYILCGGANKNITELGIPEDILLKDRPNAQTSSVSFSSSTVLLLTLLIYLVKTSVHHYKATFHLALSDAL